MLGFDGLMNAMRPHGEGDAADAQAQEAGDQMDAYTKSAAASLMEAWSIPRVLLAALEADGFLVPTPLMASVWTAGRGEYRADLLVHVSGVLFGLFYHHSSRQFPSCTGVKMRITVMDVLDNIIAALVFRLTR